MTVQLAKFLERLRTPSTRKSYEFHILKICGSEVTANAFVIKSKSEVEQYLIDWITENREEEGRERGLSGYTITTALSSIRSFFVANDRTDINWSNVKTSIPEYIRKADDVAPTLEQIRAFLYSCPLREKAECLTLISSGAREGAIATLKIRDLERKEVDGTRVGQLKMYADSKAHRYYSFITPEALEAIDKYLKQREEAGEELRPDSPLFLNDFSHRNKDTINTPRHVKPQAICALFNRLWQLAGVRKREERNGENGGNVRKEFKAVHGFRKYFRTEIGRAGMRDLLIEDLMGHRKGSIEHVYDKSTPEQKLQEYVKVMSSLYVGEEYRVKTQMETLEDNIKRIKETAAKYGFPIDDESAKQFSSEWSGPKMLEKLLQAEKIAKEELSKGESKGQIIRLSPNVELEKTILPQTERQDPVIAKSAKRITIKVEDLEKYQENYKPVFEFKDGRIMLERDA